MRFYKIRLEEINLSAFYAFAIEKCIEIDAVKCFAVFKEENYADVPKNIVYERVLRDNARKISTYYGIKPTLGTKAAGVLVDGLQAFVEWLLKP